MATETNEPIRKPVEPAMRSSLDETSSQDVLRDHSLLNLQRRAGNSAVVGLLESHGQLQTKLRTNQQSDKHEREADSAVLQVLRLSSAPTGVVQRKCATCSATSKCASCEEEERLQQKPKAIGSASAPHIQRATKNGDSAGAATPETATEAEPATAGPLLVEDDAATVAPGQMRKSEFLEQLRSTVCATADEALKEAGQSTEGCPYIEKWLSYYADQPPAYIERALRKYAPEAATATSAGDYIPAVSNRVRRGVETWAKTGELTGVPEELKDMMTGPGAALGAIGGMLGGIGSAISGAVSAAAGAIGGAFSSIGKALFKKKEGVAEATDDPQEIQAKLSGGQPLDGGASSRMGAAFGQDFSSVRVHTDSNAAGLSDQLNARAFTIGSDIAFGAGEYQPGTLIGDALIAHELAHVAQQRNGDVSPKSKESVASNEQLLEEEADSNAVHVVTSMWMELPGTIAGFAGNASSQLRSGLKLQKCDDKYSKADLKKKVDAKLSAAKLLKWINGWKGADREKAIKDLQDLRVDYVDKAIQPDAVTKMDEVLQLIYGSVATTQAPGSIAPLGGWPAAGAPAGLTKGTHQLSGPEKTAATSALKPLPSGGVFPDFHPTIAAGNYETRVRDRIGDEITRLTAELVTGKGPAEHLDPTGTLLHGWPRLKQIGNLARDEVDQVFQSYAKGPEFTPGGNLIDQFEDEETANAALGAPEKLEKAKDKVRYLITSDEVVRQINKEHGAVPGRTTAPAAGGDSEETIHLRIIEHFNTTLPNFVETMLNLERGWEGAALGGNVYLQRWKKPTEIENRAFFWETFETMIHEYTHTLAHSAYKTYARSFGKNSDEYNTLMEGGASVLAEVVWIKVKPRLASDAALRAKVEGASLPFEPSIIPDFIDTERYPSYDQAMGLIRVVGIQNFYAAYFLGQVGLIGKP